MANLKKSIKFIEKSLENKVKNLGKKFESIKENIEEKTSACKIQIIYKKTHKV